MQSTGQASMHAASLVPMHGSAITYAIERVTYQTTFEQLLRNSIHTTARRFSAICRAQRTFACARHSSGRAFILRPTILVGTGRFELPTCRLGGDRSIHLSYVPAHCFKEQSS